MFFSVLRALSSLFFPPAPLSAPYPPPPVSIYVLESSRNVTIPSCSRNYLKTQENEGKDIFLEEKSMRNNDQKHSTFF